MNGALVVQGNALRLPLPDESVDLIVTSPPYFALRAYDGDHPAMVGSEPTPREYLEALWAATAEMARVLKPSGSIFVNLGDKYASDNRGSGYDPKRGPAKYWPPGPRSLSTQHGTPAKSLMLLPERYRIGCVDHLNLIARAVIVWQKPNGLPESVADRVRRSHEDWVHLVKQPRYYAAVDEVREPHAESTLARAHLPRTISPNDGLRKQGNPIGRTIEAHGVVASESYANNPLGKLPGSVWSVPSEPLRLPDHLGVDHYACVDDQTEILTERGWLQHDQLQAGDHVAGYDEAGWARWTICRAVHRYEHDGPMVAVEKRDLSMRLTPNHRTLAQWYETRDRILTPPTIVRADQLSPKHYIPRSAPWMDTIEGQGPGRTIAALCGWIAAEGWYTKTGQVRLSQSRTANPEKVAAIDKLLASMTLLPAPDRSERTKYRRVLDAIQRTERERTWRDRRVTDVAWALPLGLSQAIRAIMPAKLLTGAMIQWSAAERRALLEAFIDGDGHRRPSGRMSIFQKERHNLDIFQAIAVTLGYKTTLRGNGQRWVLYLTEGGRSITLRGTNGASAPIPREHYKGIVWCPETGTGTFIARRNGSVFITGNSFPSEWPRRLILGWSPPGVCLACGQGRWPVVERRNVQVRPPWQGRPQRADASEPHGNTRGLNDPSNGSLATEATILGYACACTPHTNHPATGQRDYTSPGEGRARFPFLGGQGEKVGPWREYHLTGWTPPPTRPAVVLDPFAGTGTVPMVARALGRVGIGVDLSHPYCRAARWRIRHDAGKAITRTNLERQGSLL